MPRLFDALTIRGVTLRNRIGVSPMCMYSAEDGHVNEWHLVHLGARAVGGAGLIIAEATAVEPRGRITPGDAGLWSDTQVEPFARITRFLKANGAVAGVQIAHAGRKAGAARPWDGGRQLTDSEGGWGTVAPSAVAFGGDLWREPHALAREEIAGVREAFVAAARRALAAGFEWLELHSAHGYLLHSFLSPLSNRRTDGYGGSFENRMRLLLEVARAIRDVWPERLPLAVRISSTDWVDGGWTLDESVALAGRLKAEGVDLIDCSSGGNATTLPRDVLRPGYQVPFAERIRREAGIATAAVGLITEPGMAEAIIAGEQADLVLLGRAELRDPYWPLHAAKTLGQQADFVPRQYLRAFG
jgi:2,4-dienoyl-CoA reductase-like NADH-dependent reductase (Old Yellow Enzyme family)